MNDKVNNNEFDQDKNFQDLHEKYQSVSTELPPESVDANILQAAHSMHTNSKNNLQAPVKKGFMHAWYVPASAVAIIVLSLSVVLKLAFEPEFSEPLNMQPPQTEMDGAGYSADEATLQGDDSKLMQPRQLREEKKMTSQLKRRKAQQQLQQSQNAAARAPVSSEKKSLQKYEIKAAPTSNHGQAKIAAESERVQDSARKVPMAVAPASGAASSAGGVGSLAKPESDISQQAKIRHLIMLLETRQFDKLESALRAYRIEYPASYSVSEKNEALPEALLEWESHSGGIDSME